MADTRLSSAVIPGRSRTISDKTPGDYPAVGVLIEEFDIWREGYPEAKVIVFKAGTTELAPLFSDPFLTQSIPNPQILLEKEDGLGAKYGKFSTSVYTPYAYTLDINTIEQTGIRRMFLGSLAGENASYAYSNAEGSSLPRALNERFGDIINAEDYGVFGESPSTNTAILVNAISRASTLGGGVVNLPAKTIPLNAINLPAKVRLQGKGMDVTVLQCQDSGKAITITGNDCALKDIQLDGVAVYSGSVGLYALNKSRLQADNVKVRRFETNMLFQGGDDFMFRNVFVTDGTRNVRLLGDSDASNTAAGGEFTGMDWLGGEIANASDLNLDIQVIDQAVRHNVFRQIDVKDSGGLVGGVLIVGASHTVFEHFYYSGNDYHIKVEDNADVTLADTVRKVQGLRIIGGQMEEGKLAFDGLCQDIYLESVQLTDVEVEFNVPENQIIFTDCIESNTSFSGDSTKGARWRTDNNGIVKGITEDATAVVVWKRALRPNAVIHLDVQATGEQVNGTSFGVWHISHAARCAPATLAFDEQTENFIVGDVVTGATSGATAILTAQTDSGASGSLSLAAVDGEFLNNEIITGGSAGSARVNGVLAYGAVAEVGAETDLHTAGSNSGAVPTGWDVDFQVSQQEIQVTVKGASANTVFWNVCIRATEL